MWGQPARAYAVRARAQVDTLPSGEIDYADLRHHLLLNKDKPAILNVNIGTTVKGAVDDIDKVWDAGDVLADQHVPAGS